MAGEKTVRQRIDCHRAIVLGAVDSIFGGRGDCLVIRADWPDRDPRFVADSGAADQAALTQKNAALAVIGDGGRSGEVASNPRPSVDLAPRGNIIRRVLGELGGDLAGHIAHVVHQLENARWPSSCGRAAKRVCSAFGRLAITGRDHRRRRAENNSASLARGSTARYSSSVGAVFIFFGCCRQGCINLGPRRFFVAAGRCFQNVDSGRA